jgi:hypothetical protein
MCALLQEDYQMCNTNQLFLPFLNRTQLNLFISVANGVLQENVTLLNVLTKELPQSFDVSKSADLLEQIRLLQHMIAKVEGNIHLQESTHNWPVRIAMESDALVIISDRLSTVYQKFLTSDSNPLDAHMPATFRLDSPFQITSHQYNDLLLLIGSLQAVVAQISDSYEGTTVMTPPSYYRIAWNPT